MQSYIKSLTSFILLLLAIALSILIVYSSVFTDLNDLVTTYNKNVKLNSISNFNSFLSEEKLSSKFASNSYIFSPIDYKLNLINYQNQITLKNSKRLQKKEDTSYNINNYLNINNNETTLLSALNQSNIIPATNYLRENATILMLVRNWELPSALASIRTLEDRFNKNYNYPWTFLNDEPFTQEFIDATSLATSGETQYGIIPQVDWNIPHWINLTKFEQNINDSIHNNIIYGFSKSYRNMCKFNSGYFMRQELLQNYEWYFRVEPDVNYFCNFNYDPFKLMKNLNKKYGFIVSIYDYQNTIPTLWDTTMEFFTTGNNSNYLAKDNSYKFLTDNSLIGTSVTVQTNSTSDYNLCHFWSNFEIANLNFFRSKPYQEFFNYLNQKGGFYYERWGDAPVHSIAVGLLLNKSEIHHFDDIGYYHPPFNSCPSSNILRLVKNCQCNVNDENNIDTKPHSCLSKWWKFGGGKYFMQYDSNQ
ncbi:mannosyltransferase YUR1 [Ascoidea rubescens DSM 1968]|uniref:Glycosyltransferase family 15 protein n=1 Tax=Ascoidea rubescens DSM 1968 TaxID=1344418 RepID=A0A1D2VIR5_9ASCO|nr:glycosyltransferase family 15 protein [Ascoidea rubescens DSM 1968]ODV61525.1 glycosyltransferase family 15 protein [Ascoidea rubescens DSM 1968]